MGGTLATAAGPGGSQRDEGVLDGAIPRGA